MKAVINEVDPEFKPVAITITCETKEELAELWHRFNVAPASMEEVVEDTTLDYPGLHVLEAWDVVEAKVEEIFNEQ